MFEDETLPGAAQNLELDQDTARQLVGGGNVFEVAQKEENAGARPQRTWSRAELFPLIGEHSVFEPIEMEQAIAARRITTGDPDQAAVVDGLARRFKTPRAAVEATLDQTISKAIQEDNEKWVAQAPSFWSWINLNPKQAPILAKDLDKMTAIDRAMSGIKPGENVPQSPARLDVDFGRSLRQLDQTLANAGYEFWQDAQAGWGIGRNTGRLGALGLEAQQTGRANWDEINRLDAENERLSAQGHDGFVQNTAQLIATMVEGFLYTTRDNRGALTGMGLGGGAAWAGMAGTPLGLILGGASIGAGVYGAYALEAGNSYIELIKKGVDPGKARWISAGVGMVNALVEVAGVGIAGAAFKPVAGKIASAFAAKTANKLMQESGWQAVREYALASGKSVLGETFTEVLQEAVSASGEELGRIWSETGEDPMKAEEFWERLSDIAIGTMKGTVGMSALGIPARAVAFSRTRANAEQVKAKLGEVLKATGEMKAKESSPETVKEAVNSAAEQKNVGEVYVDGQEFRQILFQNNITKEELEQVAPGLWDQIEEQASNGGDVVMKTGDFMVSLSGTKIAPQLLDHVRAHQEDLSVAESRAARNEAANELKRALEAVDKGEMPDEEVVQSRKGSLSKAHRDVIDRVEKQTLEALKAAGMSEQEAKANARYQVLLLSNFARQTGIDAATLEAWAPSIQSPAAQRLLAARERTARALRGANGVELNTGLQETALEDGRTFLTYEGIADLGVLPETVENRKPVRVETGTLTAERLGRELDSLENAGYSLLQAIWEITQKMDAVYRRADGTLFIAKNIYTQRDGKFVHGLLMADLEDAVDYYRVSGLRATDNAEVLQGAERLALDESAVDPAELIGQETGIPTINGNGELAQIRSTSLPTREGFPDPYLEPVFQSYEVLKRFPETLANRVAFFLKPRENPEDAANYAGVKGAVGDAKDPRVQAERIINRLVENLLFLYNLVPEEYKQRAKLWYDGGRRAVMTWAKRYKLRPRQTAGVIAVFSPQMDWFKNMSLAERLMDIYFSAMDVRVTPEMEAWIQNRAPKDAFTEGRTVDDYLGCRFSGLTLREMIEEARAKADEQARLQDEAEARARAEARALVEADARKRAAAEARGKKLKSKPKNEEELFARYFKKYLKEAGFKDGEAKSREALFAKQLEGAPAQFIKAYNGAYFSPNYYILKPEGGSTMKSPLTKQGIPEKMNFGPAAPIAKGLSILIDGSVKNIGQQIGNEFKVRNFYNNLYAPWYSRTVTIDTHAVAAALLAPMTGSTRAVVDNFGGGIDDDIGQQGAYPIYAEAYRRAAAMVGLLPREMQSITWEAVRVLFEAEGKAALRPKVAAIWQEHDEGKITAQEARKRIFKEAGGFRKLSWQDELFGQNLDSTFDRSKVQELVGAQAAPMEPTISFGSGMPEPDPSTPLGQVWASLTPERRERAAFYARQAALSQIAKEIGAPIGEDYRRFAARGGERADRFTVQLEAGKPVQRAAQLIARVFGQDAVRVLSGTQEEGLAPRRALQLEVPWDAEDSVRQNAWEKVIRQAGGGDTLADEWGLSSLLDEEGAEAVLARAGELVSSLGEGFGVNAADLFAGEFGPALDETPGTAEVVKRAQDAYNTALQEEVARARGEQDLYERHQSDQRGDKDVLLQIETPLPGPGERAETAEQANRYDPFFAVEVAPDPNDKVLKARWENKLDDTAKLDVLKAVLPKVLEKVKAMTGAQLSDQLEQTGGYLGDVNYSMQVPVTAGDPLIVAGILAKVLRQDSVMVVSDTSQEGMSESSLLRIRFQDKTLTEDQFKKQAVDLYKNVLDKIIDKENPTVKDEDGNDVPHKLVKGMSAAGKEIFCTVDKANEGKILAAFDELLKDSPHMLDIHFEKGFSAFKKPITAEEENAVQVADRRGSGEGVQAVWDTDRLRAETDAEVRKAVEWAEAETAKRNAEKPLDSGGQTLKQINISPEQLPPDVAPQDRLVVLHETTIEKLLKSLKLGGLPMPSLGITKWLRPYSGFGEIALIGTAGMIDPASGTDVYSADAYTVRFPGLEKEINQDVINKLVADITKTAAPYGHSLSEAWLMANLGHKIFGNSDIIDVLEKSPAAQVAFLLEEDVDIAPVEFEPRGGRSHAPGLFRSETFRKLCEEWLELESPSRKDYLRIGKALNAAARKLPYGAWDGASEFARNLWLVTDEQPKYLTQFAGLVLGREEVVKSPQFTAQVLNKVKIEEAFSDNEGEFRSWAKRKTKGWLGNPMLRLGGKLVPVTLENVLKAMLLERGRNREGGSSGVSNSEIIAAGARQFESADEIKANRGQVDNSIESYEKIQAVEKAIDNYERTVTGGAWANGVAARKALVEAAKVKKPTERRLRTALEKAGFDVTQEMLDAGMAAINEVKHAVTMYFEAKPPRAVGFDEFVGAVVPEGTSEEVINALKGYGLEIETYGWKLNAFDGAVKDLSARMQEKRGDVLFQKAQQDDENIAGSYNPKTNTLRLTANANPSTFAHEMGHWFLEQSCAAARLPTCSKSFVADLEAMLRSMGVDGLAGWEAADWATRERIHEQWAAHVETYLAEGRAPNAESKPFLRRLAQMIRDFYRAWKNGTDTATRARYRMQFGEEMPDLSPEVRRMLDRMIAGEDAVLEAERKLGLSALYEGKEKPEGVSDEVWRELQEAHDDTLAEAIEDYLAKAEKDERWYDSKRGRMLRENDERAKKLREQIREEVRVAVNSRRDYTAIDLIKKPGNPLTGNNLKLSPQDLEALGYSPRQIKKLRDLGLVREGGVSVSVAREFLRPFAKFNSDRQLIEALLSAGDREKRIEAETTRECLRRYSEVFDQKEVEQRIADALHSERQARRIMLEARLLIEQRDKAAKAERTKAEKEQRAQQREHEAELRKSVKAERDKAAKERRELRDELRKSTSASRVMLAAAKEAAKRLVQDMPFNKVTLRHFLALEAKAGRKALRAVREGNVEAALEAKKQQMVFHEAARLAYQAEHDVERLKRIKSRIFQSDKKLSGTYDVRILAVARAILTNHGFGVKEKKETVPAEKWLERVRAYDPDIAKGLEEILARHPPQSETETLGEFRELMADVRALMKMAADARNSTLNGRKVNIEQAVEELVAKLSSRPQEGMPAQHRAATKGEQRHRLLLTAKAYLTRVESWCRIMDGGAPGAFTQYIYRPIAEVASKFRVQNIEYQKKLRDILKERIKAWDKVRDIEAPELKYTFGRKSELIGMLLHIGNPSNYRKLVLGGTGPGNRWASLTVDEKGVEHMNDGAFQNFLARIMRDGTLTKDDMDAIQQIWDLMEEMKPQMQKAFQSYYGYYFEEIQAKEIMTPWGVYRGGYVPAYTDAMRVSEASKQREQDLMAEADVSDVMPVRRPGSTISRKEHYTKPLNFNIGMLQGHMAKVLRFAVMAPTVKTVQRIIKDRKFAEALDGVDPTIISEMLLPWLSRAASQSVTTPAGPFGAMLNKLRSTAGMSIMAAHLANALQQFTGFSVALPLIGAGRLAVALRERALHPKQTFERVLEASDFMRARLDDMGFEYAAEIQEMAALEAPTTREKIKQWAVRNAYFFQTVMQKWVDVPVWMAAYDKAVAEGMTHEDAVAEADSVVRRTQSSFDPESVARVETGHPAVRAFLVFYNYFNMQLNLTQERAALASDTKKYGRFLGDVHLIVLIPAVLSELIMQAFTGFDTGDDDDWDALDALALFIGAPFRNFLAMVPIVGQTVNTLGARAAKKKDAIGEVARFLFGESYNERLVSIPAASIIENSIDGALDAMRYVAGEEVKERRMVRNLCDLLTVLTGAPVSALKRPVGYLTGVASGEYQPETGLDVARGLVAGREPDR